MQVNTYLLIRRAIQTLGAQDPLVNVVLLSLGAQDPLELRTLWSQEPSGAQDPLEPRTLWSSGPSGA
jgi:hypothetical protein